MERDDCDLRTEYGLIDERPVVNGIRYTLGCTLWTKDKQLVLT